MPRRKASDFGVVPANGTTNGSTSGHTNGNATEPSHGASHSTSNGAANGDNAPEVSLIDQAEAVRTSLREAVDKVGDLIGSLKKQRKQSRLVQSTLSSLRQLQTLDA